ncbi:MAG: 3,4-dihydroxy-2-butanone-4-phosphate synthase [Zoogloeaceae bacterium]|jgi:3,4-dihydroxy 2-butanone 4-phosphate synthase/GTP cyclohydrolase II|nr:3,4-dihydroxy-2-butanone-4-phosphate synthase [Zoogloeaceae bacterium]
MTSIIPLMNSPLPQAAIAPTEEIIAEIQAGRMAILVDEEDRENEGDLLIAAEHVTPEAINFMVTHCRGLVCLTITEARARQLGLAQMTRDNRTPYNTAFTISIEAAEGVTTGISAFDRARTVRAAVARNATPDDIVQPGHVFPITAKEGGVLVRAGHTEAGCDLTRLAGLEPAAVICEVLKEDGSMARLPDLLEFARVHGIKVGSIADLIHYRAASETLIERVASRPVQTAHGEFILHAYRDKASGAAHLALVKGEIPAGNETLVRVHEPLSVLDFLDPQGQMAAFSIDEAEAAIARNGHGVIVLMHHPEGSEEILTRLAANAPANRMRRQFKWDPRVYGIGAQILRDLGVSKMRLLASQRKMPSMTGFSLEVTGFVAALKLEPEAER